MNEPTRNRIPASPQQTSPDHPQTNTAQSRRTIRRIPNVPRRADLVDLGACLLLSIIAFTGLSHVYSGSEYIIVALAGVVLGGTISYAAYLLRQPLIVLVVVGGLTFFLLGGALTLRNDPGSSTLPTGGTLSALANQAVYGWKNLLSTLPPVDGTGPLLVLPYLLGLFTGLGTVALATRVRAAFAPVAVPFVTLAIVILLGDQTTTLLTLRGAGFAVVGLGWACVRAGRLRPVTHTGSTARARLGTAVAALLVAGLGAALLGPNLPGEGTHARLVLRKYVRPDPNIGNYPSPLSSFRLYRTCNKDGQGASPATPLFTVTGSLPVGTVLQFGALDTYNGSVWQVSSDAKDHSAKPNTFLKVGTTLNDPAPGPTSTITVTILDNGYNDVWMPTTGSIQTITFHGPRAVIDARDLRYNLATGTGLVPLSLQAGDSYTVRVAGTKQELLAGNSTLNSGAVTPALNGASLDFVTKAVTALSQGATGSPSMGQTILNLGMALQHAGGASDCQKDYQYYLGGATIGRLTDYVNGIGGATEAPKFVGDNEQSAALFALMIESLGVPVRVVMGVDAQKVVTGQPIRSDMVTAWVEVEDHNQTWLTIPASKFDPSTPPDKQPQTTETNPTGAKPVPPPSQGRPKSPLDDSSLANGASGRNNANKPQRSGSLIGLLPAWVRTLLSYTGPPTGILALIAALIVGLKWGRRRQRARRGPPAQRLEHGWNELVDNARDLGVALVARRTRLEHAALLTSPDANRLARLADATIFGPAAPSDADAATYWSEVHAARKRMLGGVGRLRRIRAALSLASFRRLQPGPGS